MQINKANIFVEQAQVLQQQKHEQRQYILRLQAPRCATDAIPGQFVYLQCQVKQLTSGNLLRRPYSILATNIEEGWIELLYKSVGQGSQILTQVKPGQTLSCMGAIGNGFVPHKGKKRPLLMGGGIGMPPILFFAQRLKQQEINFNPLVLLGSESPFPFAIQIDEQSVSGISSSATLAYLHAQGISSRLCSQQSYVECFDGRIDTMAESWLTTLNEDALNEIEIFACGPTAMLKSCVKLASHYNLPCQICVEEYMACGVGACAGCTILVAEENKKSMRRVCVDGPVFDGRTVCF